MLYMFVDDNGPRVFNAVNAQDLFDNFYCTFQTRYRAALCII